MKKSLSLSVLGITVASLLLIGVGLIKNEPRYDFADIKGSKENLGNVSFVQTNYVDLYKNIKSTVSKDGFKVKKYTNDKSVKDGEYGKIIVSNKDLFEYSHPLGSGIYKSDENIGYVEECSQNYNGDGTYTQQILIRNKNLKTNEINESYVDFPENIKEGENTESGFAVSIKGNNIYILRGITEGISYKNEGEIDKFEDSYLNLYVFNLDNQELKLKDSYKNVEKDGYKYIFNMNEVFKKDNKIYTLVGKVNLKDKNRLDYYLLYYNLNNNKFETIKEPVLKDTTAPILGGNIIISKKLEGDTLYILEHDKSKEKNANIEISKVNLKDNKVEYIDKKYNIANASDEYDCNEFRVIDNKIYMGMTVFEEKNQVYGPVMNTKELVVVIDENTGQTLYKGEYLNERDNSPQLEIVMNNEL